MNFEWDENKAQNNITKHGISFDEAKTVFSDPLAHIFDDIWHSDNEPRELIVGISRQCRLLIVCFTERMVGTIRIISSREATTRERKEYEEHRHH